MQIFKPTWLIMQILGIFRLISLSFRNTMTTKRLVVIPQVDISVWRIFIRSVLSPAWINSTVVVATRLICVFVSKLDAETFSKTSSDVAIVRNERLMLSVFTAPAPFYGFYKRCLMRDVLQPLAVFYFWCA